MAREKRSEPVLILQRRRLLLHFGEGQVLFMLGSLVRIYRCQTLIITYVAGILDHSGFIFLMGLVLISSDI
jgi:hypothetical protein